MKKTIIHNLIIIFITCLSCKAQITQVFPIQTSSIGKPENSYYKDLNNEFNKFEGTWKYENGNTSFTITLEKKEMIYFETSEKYIDILCGEYSYIENSVTIVNTLPMLIQHPEFGYRNIGNGRIINNDQVLVCDDCDPNEKRVKLYFNDPERDYLNPSLILQMVQEENTLLDQEGIIKVTLIGTGGFIPNENSPTETRVPYGEYIMIKQ